MIKIENIETREYEIIEMHEMRPLQVGIIVQASHSYYGDIVMRTASQSKFEVMNLTSPRSNNCWMGYSCSIKVRLLAKNETVTIKLFNDE